MQKHNYHPQVFVCLACQCKRDLHSLYLGLNYLKQTKLDQDEACPLIQRSAYEQNKVRLKHAELMRHH